MSWEALETRVQTCEACARLTTYRVQVAQRSPRRYDSQTYYARPVPGFGDSAAQLWIIGLAPAAHGANRTGRMFTGDRSGEWLYRILYEMGLSSAPTSLGPGDGLRLYGVYVSAVLRCAPPNNKPLPSEIVACRRYLEMEWSYLRGSLRVILALGAIAHKAACQLLGLSSQAAFSHGARYESATGISLLSSYHPSQQNTFTRRLTWEMWQEVFIQAREAAFAPMG